MKISGKCQSLMNLRILCVFTSRLDFSVSGSAVVRLCWTTALHQWPTNAAKRDAVQTCLQRKDAIRYSWTNGGLKVCNLASKQSRTHFPLYEVLHTLFEQLYYNQHSFHSGLQAAPKQASHSSRTGYLVVFCEACAHLRTSVPHCKRVSPTPSVPPDNPHPSPTNTKPCAQREKVDTVSSFIPVEKPTDL